MAGPATTRYLADYGATVVKVESATRIETGRTLGDRKSTRLNSSHANISYAVFCLKKKTQYARGSAPLAPRRGALRSGPQSADPARRSPDAGVRRLTGHTRIRYRARW